MSQENPIALRHWLTLTLISFIWGSSFILMKKGMVAFSPNQVASMRIFFSFVTLSPLIFTSFKKIKKENWLPIAAISVFGSGVPPFLFTTAQTQITSAAAGILNAVTPLFAFLIGIAFFGMLFRWQKFLGVLLGLAGAIFLISFSQPLEITGNNWYGIYVILASLCYGIGINMVKNKCQDIPPIALNVMVFSMIGPIAGAYLFSTNFVGTLTTVPGAWEAFGYILILAIIGTAFATILFYKLAQETDAIFASTTTYMIPVFAVLWGLLDQEAIGLSYVFGLLMILGGVYLASR